MYRTSPIRHRRTPLAVCAFSVFVAIAAIAAALTSSARAASGTPDAQLLQTYQPVLVLHPNELFRPTKVQSFVEDSELERFVGSSAAQLPFDAFWTVVDPDPEPGDLPPLAAGIFYRLDQIACEADAGLGGRSCYAASWKEEAGGDAVYGRVVRTPSRIVLQYWLFYYDNPLVLPTVPGVGTFWQSHEGDWEHVDVVLGPDETPLEAAYSQHCSGQRKAWGGVPTSPAGSTHPVAFVALGSHANYFAPGTGPLGAIPISPACLPATIPSLVRPFVVDQVLDGSSSGAVVGPPGSGVDGATIHRIEGNAWAGFGGQWGESEYFFTPVAFPPVPANTALPVGLAPASPANQTGWNVSTVLDWPLVP